MAREKKAHFAGGPVPVIGRSVDDDGEPVRTVPFVADLLDLALAALARGARNRALDVIRRHVEPAGFFNRHLQPVIGFGIGRAALRCEDQLFAKLGEEGTALGVDLPLLQLDIVPF
ncbi:MAG: hypothetical protein WBE83_10940 [Candidatus Cybelea sp.]